MDTTEIYRRREASIEALERIRREKFNAWYQEECDKHYWQNGQCCAGCDHWVSDRGFFGKCKASRIVSGKDVLRSIGICWATYTPPPGHPYTQHDYHCGLFRDDFDWESLEPEYLSRIGAMENGVLKEKPGPHQ